MRKKVITLSYFLIDFNTTLGNSLGKRVKYVGLNLMVGGYAFGRYFNSMQRLRVFHNIYNKAAPGEHFE